MNPCGSLAIAKAEHFYNCELTLYLESLPVLQLALGDGKANLKLCGIRSWCLKKTVYMFVSVHVFRQTFLS